MFPQVLKQRQEHAVKAAVYDEAGSPAVFRYADLPDPQFGADDVLISVEAISIEGGDLINRRSSPPPHPSFVVGYAAAGTIVAVGANVDTRAVGDRVASFDMQGSHASMRAVPASRTWHLPDGVGMPQAACVPIAFGTAHHCLFARAKIEDGETILIQAAAGGVGVAAVQLASQAGATVIAVASGTERRERLIEFGARHVIDRRAEDVVEAVMRITDEWGVDVVIDPVGAALQASLAALATEGRLVFVGNAGGGNLSVDLWPALQANQTLYGVFMGPLLERPAVHATINAVFEAIAAGRIEVAIERTFPLAEAEAAHGFAENASPLGRVVLQP
jgi:NADPH:quinone reductase-like Zn-dependent oxidoreductase